jgi:hypothetical protein
LGSYTSAAAAVVLTVGLALAGCVGDAPTIELTGKDARYLDVQGFALHPGYTYDGTFVQKAEGTLSVKLNDEDNTGLVTATVTTRSGTTWTITFDEFAGTVDRQGGGVRFNFDEHGNTGNGTPELPKFYALAAAWGTATITKDGQKVQEPNTLGERFSAHLMVVKGQVRNPDTGRILKMDKTCCYDPSAPLDGHVSEIGSQAILQAKTKTGAFFLHLEFEDLAFKKLPKA